MEECVTCKVVPGVSDHMMVLCSMELRLFSDVGVHRECYQYNKANWPKLNNFFKNTDWTNMLSNVDVQMAVEVFTEYVIRVSEMFIPFEKNDPKKQSPMVK